MIIFSQNMHHAMDFCPKFGKNQHYGNGYYRCISEKLVVGSIIEEIIILKLDFHY